MGRGRKYTKELLTEAVEHSTSVAGVLRYLGLIQAGGTHTHISRTIKRMGIDTRHFRLYSPTAHQHRRLTAAQILIVLPPDSRRAKPTLLTRALIESGVPYECSACGLDGSWQGIPLTLEVDHIDGNYLDNRLANLRFLCPNCHRQTPNFAGRSRGKNASPLATTRDEPP